MSDMTAKIAKLLALAESSNPHEAELAQAQAERLMVKWGIDEAVVRALDKSKGRKKVEVVEKRVHFFGIYAHASQLMGSGMGHVYGSVRVLVGQGYAKDPAKNDKPSKAYMIYVIGHEDEVDRFITLIRSLEVQATNAVNAWWKGRERSRKENGVNDYDPFSMSTVKLTPMEAFKARRQFIISFSAAAQSRVAKMRASVLAEVKKERGGTSTELALTDQAAEVDAFMKRVYPSLKSVRSNLKGSSEGRTAGHRAGASADIGGTQITR